MAQENRRIARRVALRFARDIEQLLEAELDPERVEDYIQELVASIDDLEQAEKDLEIDLRGMAQMLRTIEHSDDIYHNGETILEHIKWVLQDVHRLTEGKDKELRGILSMAALLHDLGKVYTHEVTPEGHHQFHGHAQKSVLIAEKMVAALQKKNADLAELIVQLVKHHDSFLALLHSKTQGASLKYLNKFMREAIYTKGHLEKLLLFTKADASRSKVFAETLKNIEGVLEDLATVEKKQREQAERGKRIQERMGEIRRLLEAQAPELVHLLPDLSAVNTALGKQRRYDVLQGLAKIISP